MPDLEKRDGSPVVEVRGLMKAFGGVRAADNVSLDIHPGEILALLGHNGAGKSTVVSVISGAVQCDSGEIRVNGEAVSIGSPQQAKDLGIETIYQSLALADNLDATANLFLGRELRRFRFLKNTKPMRAAAVEALRQVNPRFTNIDDEAGKLSGGQRQSIAIARAVYFKAKVIIMDEPTAALGPAEASAVEEVMLRLRASGVAVLLIAHDIDLVLRLADRLIIMADGKVVRRLDARNATKDEVLATILLGEEKTRLLTETEAAGDGSRAESSGVAAAHPSPA